jgi:hypothetical protein
VILGIVEAISRFIVALETRGVTTIPMPDGRLVPIPSNPVGDAFGGLIGAFVGFFVLSGIIYISAKIFGGQGSFLTQSWLLSLFYVPLNIIAAIAGIIPLLGSLVALATFIYGIVLSVMAVASAHRMTTGRATAAVLLPLIVIFALVCAFAAALVALLIAIFHAAAS